MQSRRHDDDPRDTTSTSPPEMHRIRIHTGNVDPILIFDGGQHTTPPRPVDVEALLPGIERYRAEAVRLHPRTGSRSPGERESSVGGPLLWPAAEPWPQCDDLHPHTRFKPSHDGQLPMVPVVQLFAVDVPELPFPPGTDVLQVVWCPFDHDDGYVPRPEIYWRCAADIGEVLATPPTPTSARDEYIPSPCTIDPERIVEYPNWDLPDDAFEGQDEVLDDVELATGWIYWSHLSVAPGIKVGGYPGWTQDPNWPLCPGCRQQMDHLLTVKSAEFDGESWRTWLPEQDAPTTGNVLDLPYETRTKIQRAHGLMLGDMGGIYLFICPRCPETPFAYRSDCS